MGERLLRGMALGGGGVDGTHLRTQAEVASAQLTRPAHGRMGGEASGRVSTPLTTSPLGEHAPCSPGSLARVHQTTHRDDYLLHKHVHIWPDGARCLWQRARLAHHAPVQHPQLRGMWTASRVWMPPIQAWWMPAAALLLAPCHHAPSVHPTGASFVRTGGSGGARVGRQRRALCWKVKARLMMRGLSAG